MRKWLVGVGCAVLICTLTTHATHASAIVRLVDLGNGANEEWIFVPGEPPVCELVFLHDEGDLSPAAYSPWLSHVAVGDHCVVVYPRYEGRAGASTASDLRAIRVALAEAHSFLKTSTFGTQGERAAADLPFVAGGFGTGATLAIMLAADGARFGAPRAVALDVVFPVTTRTMPLPSRRLQTSVRVLMQLGDRDRVAGKASARAVRQYLSTQPASHRQIVVVRSGGAFAAVHEAPLGQSAAAQLTFWQPLDVLLMTVS